MNETEIVIFDLDGTITRKDTYIPYLLGCLVRNPRRIGRVIPLPLFVVLFWAGLISNEKLKTVFLKSFLCGMEKEEIKSWTKKYLNNLRRNGIRKDAIEEINRYKDKGARLILLTASLDIYVNELGRQLGFHRIICTRTEWKNNRITGRIATRNRHGEEKARIVKILRNEYKYSKFIAYADHKSDIGMLKTADGGVLVTKKRKLMEIAKEVGLQTLEWRNK